jgi:hypothetical protein
MRERLNDVSGIDWGDGAVMNANWTGPLLRDVLERAGVKAGPPSGGYEGLHVQFECNATKVQDDDWYGGSIPLGVAMDSKREVLLALKVRSAPFLSMLENPPFQRYQTRSNPYLLSTCRDPKAAHLSTVSSTS